MNKFRTRVASSVTAGLLITLTACGGSGGDSGPGTGTLGISLTDGPIEEASAVHIQFTGLELIGRGDGPPETYPFDPESCDDYDPAEETCTIDLLALQGTELRTVFAEELPLGTYQQIRLLVNADLNVLDSYIEYSGPVYCPLYIPSGAETGLKLNGPIEVVTNGARYILDVDLHESILKPPGLGETPSPGMPEIPEMCMDNYVLKPVIRMVDQSDAGSIGGVVDRSVFYDTSTDTPLFEGCVENTDGFVDSARVYAFEDFVDQSTPAALDDSDAELDSSAPVASAMVDYDQTTGEYSYEIGHLLSGNYLLGLACNADLDDPVVEDFITGVDGLGTCGTADAPAFCFVDQRAIDVQAGGINEANFPGT